MDSIKVKSFKLFIVVVLVLTCVVETLIITTQNGALYLALMWIPAISAIISNVYEIVIRKDLFTLKRVIKRIKLKVV